MRTPTTLRLYLRYLAISLRAQLQYRASFVMSALGQFLFSAIEIVGIWALFDRFGHVQGWTLPQVALFYAVVNGSFAVAESLSTGFDYFGSRFVRTGDFDRLLLRPRSTVLQLAGYQLDLKRIGRALPAAIVFAIAVRALDIHWGAAQLGLLALAGVGTVCLFFGLIVLQATLCFWTTETLEITNVVTHGGVETAQYPLSIYEPAFRRFFVYVVPLGCVCYFPVVAILGVDDPLGTSRTFQALAPLSGVAFLLVSLQIWQLGVRRYTSTGS